MEQKWKWNYGDGVLVLPASALSADATPEQLRVLMWLASDPSLSGKATQLARLAGCNAREAEEAIRFWISENVLCAEGSEPAGKNAPETPVEKTRQSGKAPSRKPLQRSDEMPNYTSTELADMMEERDSLRALVNESQNIFGKMFNPHELNILFGMVDYLGLDEEYILLLLAHCRRIDIKTLRYAEKYAIGLIDRGITTAAALEERVQEIESTHELEKRVRSMFGMKSRELTSKERRMLETWVGFGYGEDVIRKAYEITVNTINEASLPYANSILERWHSEGLLTLADIEQDIASKSAEASSTSLGNSFNTDDFFQAAIERSLRDREEK